MRIRRPWLLVLLLLTAPAGAQADTVVLKRGSPVRARLWEQGATEVLVNTYFTGIRSVTHGTERIPAGNVKKVVPDPDPHRGFWARAGQIAQGGAAEWTALGNDALAAKLKGLAAHAFTEALVRDTAAEEARKGLGPKLKETLASDPRLHPEVRTRLDHYLTLEDPGAREKAQSELQALGCAFPPVYLDRAWRSARQKKGRTDGRALTFRSAEHKGTYCLFVPDSYDPWRPTPLLVGLHGGGAGGKDRDAVVGSGESAMNFYQHDAAKRGVIVVCPTALAAPWREEVNDGFLLAVVEEAAHLFNIDRNRIYLTGHSMGGYGTWHFGPKYAHLWAAIAPMAGGGRPDLGVLEDTKTGVYVYHGADDNVVGAGADREVAEEMRRRGMDFVYAEIPGAGHGFPDTVAQEMWAYFEVRRLAAAPDFGRKGKFTITEGPRSSFLERPKKEEIRYFGPLGQATAEDGDGPDLPALIADLKLGGGLAEKAAARITERKNPDAAGPLGRILGDPKAGKDSRRLAAETLGRLGHESAAKPLKDALDDPDLDVLAASGWALGRVPGAGVVKALDKAARALKARFDGKKIRDEWDYSDFEAFLAAAGRLAEGAGAAREPGGGAVMEHLAEDFVFPLYAVSVSERAGENADAPRRRMARALVAACSDPPKQDARPLLEKLVARPELGVAGDARELLQKIPAAAPGR